MAHFPAVFAGTKDGRRSVGYERLPRGSTTLNGRVKIIALDLLPMDAVASVEFIQGDFTNDATLEQLTKVLQSQKVDLVMSDMAPNISGMRSVDQPKAMYLAELALDIAKQYLRSGGSFVTKLFHGEGFDEYVKLIRHDFGAVKVRKPAASRARSRETYLIAKDYGV